ncbi:MAG: endopeptidase La [Candidatus Sumerlaeia bacterium]|nr:endopeptidase La [Candidatus Sumerlaeia bacterium]
MSEFKSKFLPILPLLESITFPGGITPLVLADEYELKALEDSQAKQGMIFLGVLKDLPGEQLKVSDLHRVGTISRVVQSLNQEDGTVKVLVEGLYTGRLVEVVQSRGFFEGYAVNSPVAEPLPREMNSLRKTAEKRLRRFVEGSESISRELVKNLVSTKEPLKFVELASHYLPFAPEEKYQILAAEHLEEKYLIFLQLIDSQIEIQELETKISQRVDQAMGRNQREYYLSEQLKAIESELGMGPENDPDLKELEQAIAEAGLSEEAREKAEKELRRLGRMQMMSPEASIARTYIEWLTEIPWKKATEDNLELNHAREVLNKDHHGLEKIKERIVEFLAVVKMAGLTRGSILCLVGAPGVGKTSLGRSIAECMGRKFVRIALGGVRDEAEIRGHRRTYIGALPGRIIQSMKKAGVVNPVILLDEVDKLSSDFRGDPASALLEVLDPEQNHAFYDHYMEVEYDLSKVMFVTTANSLSGIPEALQDRLEIIRVAGYTHREKTQIALYHLLPKQRERHGLKPRQMKVNAQVVQDLITSYTREAGVRNLERFIATLCRKTATRMVDNPRLRALTVTTKMLGEMLGPAPYSDEEMAPAPEVGMTLGLAWTSVGGELLPVEATLMKGKATLQLTGQLGNVMQESAKAALSYARTHSEELGISVDFDTSDIHIHVPEGAIPKDGPSAGITMASCLISLLSNRPARQDIAMTGEMTLRGRVLKIGGLKEKVLAAHRRGVTQIIFPKGNEPDLVDIPEDVRQEIVFHPVETIDQVLELVLIPKGKSTDARQHLPKRKSERKQTKLSATT